MIALVMAAAAIIWASVNSLLQSQIDKAPCIGNFDDVKIEKRYTCYYSDNTLRFSVSIGDVDVDKVLFSVSNSGGSESFEIEKTPGQVAGGAVINFSDKGSIVFLPGKNSGRTYNYTSGSKPLTLDIAPTIGGKRCETSDTLDTIESCTFLEN